MRAFGIIIVLPWVVFAVLLWRAENSIPSGRVERVGADKAHPARNLPKQENTMSTKGTIAGIETEGMFVHLYNECSDGNPQPVYIEMWEQGENTNHTMVVCMPQDKALELADDMAMWAKSIREFNAKEKP